MAFELIFVFFVFTWIWNKRVTCFAKKLLVATFCQVADMCLIARRISVFVLDTLFSEAIQPMLFAFRILGEDLAGGR